MRLSLGCLEVSSGWCFDASHVAGVDSFKVAFDRGSRRWLMISCTRFGPMLLGSLQILGLYVGFSVVDVSMIDRGSPVLTHDILCGGENSGVAAFRRVVLCVGGQPSR